LNSQPSSSKPAEHYWLAACAPENFAAIAERRYSDSQ
jgi:hypothetical protein